MTDEPVDDQPVEETQGRGAPTAWMRALRYHRPHGRAVDEGDLYLAHEEEVENLMNLRMAVREPPPPHAVREPKR